jgi:hypothetical protein
MPFEQSKPPAEEHFDSPEFELLSDQLRRDAQWLAARYPAHKPRLPLVRPRRLRWIAVASVAMLVLLAIDAWRMWNNPMPATSPPDNMSVRATVPAVAPAIVKQKGLIEQAIPALTSPRPLGYNDLNPAEKEAVLDLLEERPPANLKISL